MALHTNLLPSFKRWITRREETGLGFAAVVTALYALVVIVGHAHHEMWRDEVHCWMIGRDATGLSDLITGDRRYDGHPILWYYLLHLLSRFSTHYAMLHVAAGTAATISAFLWTRFAPLPRYARLLYLGSYCILFEYALISRAYAVGVMLTHLFCASFHPRRIRYFTLSIILVLLALTSLYGMVMACAFAFFLFTQPWDFTTHRPWYETLRRPNLTRDWALGLVAFVGGLVFTAVTTIPPKDAIYGRWNFNFDTNTVIECVKRFWRGIVPVPISRINFWNSNVFLDDRTFLVGVDRNVFVWAAIALLVAWCLVMIRRPRIVVTYLMGIAVMAFFQSANYSGSMRHFGHYSILLFACVWLFARVEKTRPLSWQLRSLFVVHVAIQVYAGVIAYSIDYREPFSGALEVARYIQRNDMTKLPLIAGSEALTISVAGMLPARTSFYSMETHEELTHTSFHGRRRYPNPMQTLVVAKRRSESTGKDVLVIMAQRFANVSMPNTTVELLLQTPPCTEMSERYFLYRVRSKSAAQ